MHDRGELHQNVSQLSQEAIDWVFDGFEVSGPEEDRRPNDKRAARPWSEARRRR
jgi:hypothetical protein